MSYNFFATGNWGCGAFGGDRQLKFIEQWIASSISNMRMIYNTDLNNVEEVTKKIMKKYNTSSLFLALEQYKYNPDKLFEYLLKTDPPRISSQPRSTATITQVPTTILPTTQTLSAEQQAKIESINSLQVNVGEILLFIKENAKQTFNPQHISSVQSISLKRHQILSIICYTFLLSFSSDPVDLPYFKVRATNLDFKFDWLGKGEAIHNKIDCIVNYFKIYNTLPPYLVDQTVEIFKRTISANSSLQNFSPTELIKPEFTFKKIEQINISNVLQADFANKYIGGFVLTNGCVQEEIRFVISPECLVSLLFMTEMRDNEAIHILNTIQFSSYTGYGRDGDKSFRFSNMPVTLTTSNIVAIDAVNYGKSDKSQQFSSKHISRDIIKCLAGIYTNPSTDARVTSVQKSTSKGTVISVQKSTSKSPAGTVISVQKQSDTNPLYPPGTVMSISNPSTPEIQQTNTNGPSILPVAFGTAIAGIVLAATFAGGKKTRRKRKKLRRKRKSRKRK